MAAEQKRKVRNLKPYSKLHSSPSSNGEKGKAVKREGGLGNLELADWLLVFKYCDDHPTLTQEAVVSHFRTQAERRLFFTQGTLSRNLKPTRRKQLEDRVDSNPSALKSKRPRIVTRPDVERCLVLWVRDMEEKKEVVNGAMLVEKRKQFEDLLNVPDEERLKATGWVDSFCKT